MYARFGLTLALTRACNLRCAYCYAGAKTRQTLPECFGRKAIDRAVRSIAPGGLLDLGFFGGEPLLEADLAARLIDYAEQRTAESGASLSLTLTTNGTLTTEQAWAIMIRPEMELAVSCDGLPEIHDRYRRDPNGSGSFERVRETMSRLLASGKDLRVVMVVRPDTVEALPDCVAYLWGLGVRRVEPSLDLWSQWSRSDIGRLTQVVRKLARIWQKGLPDHGITWFDEKAAYLARWPSLRNRCGFGTGELAVATSGRLYPCERLIGDDPPETDLALPGHVADGKDFLGFTEAAPRCQSTCGGCAMMDVCNTFCRCGNYIRTGDVTRPDGLLCAWNQACLQETARIAAEAMRIDGTVL